MTIRKLAKAAGLAAILAAGVATTLPATAHGIWFAQRATQLAFLYGVGADDLDSLKRLPLVSNMAAYDADGKPVQSGLQADGRLVLVNLDNQPAIVTAVLDNGTWTKSMDGVFHKKGRDEIPKYIISEHTYKYAVHLRSPLKTPLGPLPNQTLQIVPVNAALPAMKDEPIKLRVLYQGKPIAGAKILQDWVNDPDAEPVVSGADGTATIKVRNQGLNVIVATYVGPSDQPNKYDTIEHLASLSFVLAHKPE
jgi:nickel transport protein